MPSSAQLKIIRWIFRPRGPETGFITLSQRRIFIIPTRHGLVFGVMLLPMLLGSINYNLSLGFALTFLLGGLGMVSILHTFRNLAGLRIQAGRAKPVFAGATARFGLHVDNPGPLARYAVGAVSGGGTPVFTDIPAQGAVSIEIGIPAPRRGLLPLGRITVFTRFPLGLYYAWSYLEPDMSCLIYPRPDTGRVPPPASRPQPGQGAPYGTGDEDFAGFRAYHPGDSPQHIAWKAAARGQGLLTKQFSGKAEMELWLDWEHLPAELDTEAKLSRLARWVLDCHRAGFAWGLRLPGATLPPETGEAHRERCLAALALFEWPATRAR